MTGWMALLIRVAKIAAVPLPWWTSQSRINTRRTAPRICISRAATAVSLNTQ